MWNREYPLLNRKVLGRAEREVSLVDEAEGEVMIVGDSTAVYAFLELRCQNLLEVRVHLVAIGLCVRVELKVHAIHQSSSGRRTAVPGIV